MLNEFSELVPLEIIVGIEEAALPQACDLLCLFLSGIPRHCSENHQGPTLLGHLQQLLRLGRVHLGEVDRGWRPLVLGQVTFLNVIILLWSKEEKWRNGEGELPHSLFNWRLCAQSLLKYNWYHLTTLINCYLMHILNLYTTLQFDLNLIWLQKLRQ